MALTRNKIREILSTAGVDSDHMENAIQAIVDGHTATVESLKEERDNYKKTSDENAKAKAELDEIKKVHASDEPYEEKYNLY